MNSVICPHCDDWMELQDAFGMLLQSESDPLRCPLCGKPYVLHYESIWDDGMDDTASFFWAEKVEESS